MPNERITENIMRNLLKGLGYYQDGIVVEEQISQIEEIKKLLKGGSKTGGTGRGAPEFIISAQPIPDFLIIIECKADTAWHESRDRNKPTMFAVDGVLLYAAKLSKSYNVIALAVSGQTTSSLKVSAFIHVKNGAAPKELRNEHGTLITEILPLDDFIRHGSYDKDVAKERETSLMAFSRELHDFMRDHAKLTESEKPLLVSGTLIALRNTAFANSYAQHTPEKLQKHWLKVIQEEIEDAAIPNSKKTNMVQPYSSIGVHPELGKPKKDFPRGILFELIRQINERVWPFLSIYHDFDVVGQFYGEFLKYTGGDKKALGIVLTPRHVTELFAYLANLQKNSKVLDTCCGTGGFLISAMHHMMRQATTLKEKDFIRAKCLVGVEQQPSMYALAASNMILRGDGKANLYQGSCFDRSILDAIKQHYCTVGMINPPYSQKDTDSKELVFVLNILDCLVQDATCIAIVPMSCAIKPNPVREELLKHHTLEAVMSMPDQLFYPVGVVTCIMVFTAHRPHLKNRKKTWFGYWKDDSFVKTKHKGRIDLLGKWPAVRDSWVEAFRNRESIPGLSVKKYVTHEDEWCAEANMITDYSIVTADTFKDAVTKHLMFKYLGGETPELETNSVEVNP